MNADVTTIVISDPVLLAKLATATGRLVFEAPSGTYIQTMDTVPFGKPPNGYQLPITDEELERRRQEKTGRSVTDIIRDLQQKHGE